MIDGCATFSSHQIIFSFDFIEMGAFYPDRVFAFVYASIYDDLFFPECLVDARIIVVNPDGTMPVRFRQLQEEGSGRSNLVAGLSFLQQNCRCHLRRW